MKIHVCMTFESLGYIHRPREHCIYIYIYLKIYILFVLPMNFIMLTTTLYGDYILWPCKKDTRRSFGHSGSSNMLSILL
jgi:hypothetical protein